MGNAKCETTTVLQKKGKKASLPSFSRHICESESPSISTHLRFDKPTGSHNKHIIFVTEGPLEFDLKEGRRKFILSSSSTFLK